MRFGKRSKTAGITGIRLLHEREPLGKSTAVATAERSALLKQPEAPPVQEHQPVELPPMTADPTQRLLTALGRFQRQVAKSEVTPAQAEWCDECIHQLISGIEIAHSQGWENVREALTDTARVLQSYEEAGRAPECRGFLQDAYEILCLMVGDIIVDNTRSGVTQKWRDRYASARRELTEAGLHLIDDEEEPQQNVPEAGFRKTMPQQAEELVPEIEDVGEPVAETLDFIPDEDEQEAAPALAEARQPVTLPEEEWHETPSGSPDVPWSMPQALAMQTHPEGGYEEPELIEPGTLMTEEATPPAEEMLVEGHSMAELDEPPFGAPEIVEMPVAEHFDVEAALEASAPAEAAPATPEAPAHAEMPTGETEELAYVEDEYLLPAMTEEQDLFTGVEEPACSPEPSPEVAEERTEDAVDTPDDASGALFQAVQRAVSRGDVATAKVLALQLAAAMAKLEVERVQHELERARQRLTDNEQATELARQEVAEAEQSLRETELRIAEAQAEFENRRQQCGELRERVVAIEAVIEDIDAQILALQERRETELQGQQQVERDLEEALAEESRVQTGLEELSEAEQQRQQGLEEARERVGELQAQREQRLLEIAQAQAALQERLHSADDIQRTLGPSESAGAHEQGTLPLEAEEQHD